MGELIRIQDAYGFTTRIDIDYFYLNSQNQSVLKKTLTNPNGVQTILEFDALSRIVSIVKKDAMGILLSSQNITYDAVGNKSYERHEQISEGSSLGSKTTHWIYDSMGLLEQEIEGFSSSDEKIINYTYNSFGQLATKSLQGQSSPLTFSYDKRGNLNEISYQSSDNKSNISITYGYDEQGNVISAQQQNKSISRVYNRYHQVLEEIVRDSDGTHKILYTYDRKGRVKTIVLPDRSTILYTYNALFGKQVQHLTKEGKILYTHSYDEFDEQGRLICESPIGYCATKQYVYDLKGQKIALKNGFFSESYDYNSLGQLKEIKRKAEFSVSDESFEYNALSQLVSERDKTYVCDSLNNRLKVNEDTLSYNSLNQIVSQAQNEFNYDIQGNLVKKLVNGEETKFESNVFSQLLLQEKEDKSTLFEYDPFGRLMTVKHQMPGGQMNKERLIYIHSQDIGSLNEGQEIIALRIPGIYGDELSLKSVAIEIKGDIFVPVHDISGNVIALIDPIDQDIQERYCYSAFGEEEIFDSLNRKVIESKVGNPWRFAEKRKVGDLIYFGFRFYDPGLGMWISQDPLGFDEGPNLYSYLNHNPISYVDHYGLSAENAQKNTFLDYFFGEVESHCFCEKHRTCKRGGDIGKTTSNRLPKVRYYEEFENYCCSFHPTYDPRHYSGSSLYNFGRSTTYNLGKPDLQDMGIGFINGMNTSVLGGVESANYISKLAGGCNVHAVYNASHGVDLDGIECAFGLNRVATEPVHQLHKMWNNFFDQSSANAKFLMICHSQGAIHTYAMLCLIMMKPYAIE